MCTKGYHGMTDDTGDLCEDVDECELDSCDAKNSYGESIASCENHIGTYSCSCDEGYLTGLKLTHF